MTINEYNRYGRVGKYVLCEDPSAYNALTASKKGFAFAVGPYDECDNDGFYPCVCFNFDLHKMDWWVASTGGMGEVFLSILQQRNSDLVHLSKRGIQCGQ